jgi:hypothetical protein
MDLSDLLTAEAQVGEVVHTPLMSANRKIQPDSCVWRFVVVDRSALLLWVACRGRE